MSVCVFVCLSVREDVSGTTCATSTKFFVRVAYVRGMLTIGRIACRRDGGDGSAQHGRSVIYDCLVIIVRRAPMLLNFMTSRRVTIKY